MSKKGTISQKIEKLNGEVEWFYGDEFTLDEAAEKYRAAIGLTKEIESDLNNLKNEITMLAEDFS